TSHSYSPHADSTGFPAVTWRNNIVYIYGPIFQDYQSQGDIVYRRVVRNALNLLLPVPLLSVDAPPATEATVMRQGGRFIVHLVNYQPNRRGNHVEVIEEVVPMRDVPIALRMDSAPSRVYMAPSDSEIAVDY